MNSMKKYPNSGCKGAALLNSNLLAARYILSVYQASALSKSESPVLNGPPREVSFAGYSLLMVSRVLLVTVEGSMRRPRMNVSSASSSSAGGVFKPRTDWLKTVPSFS